MTAVSETLETQSIFNIEFENVLKPLLSRGVKCILAGDYNINLLNHFSNNDTGNFVNNVFDMSVLPMIKRPTRYGENRATLIDNILSNKLYDNNLSGIILDDLSDHLPVFFVTGDLVIPGHQQFITKRIRNVSDQNLCLLRNRLQNVFWENCRVSDVNLS